MKSDGDDVSKGFFPASLLERTTGNCQSLFSRTKSYEENYCWMMLGEVFETFLGGLGEDFEKCFDSFQDSC